MKHESITEIIVLCHGVAGVKYGYSVQKEGEKDGSRRGGREGERDVSEWLDGCRTGRRKRRGGGDVGGREMKARREGGRMGVNGGRKRCLY